MSTSTEPENESEGMFGGLASSASQRRYHVSWSPCLPAVVSASSFDRKVQFFSMVGAKSRLGRAPKWLRRPVGATFGFGGKLVTFDSRNQPTTAPAAGQQNKKTTTSAVVRIHQVVEDSELVQASDLFHDIVAKGEFKEFCDLKSQSAEVSASEKQVWSLMNVICFGSNAREELLTHLGFDSASITATAQEYVNQHNPNPTSNASESTPNPGLDMDTLNINNDETSILTAEDMFAAEPAAVTPPPPVPTIPKVSPPKEQPVLPEDIAKTAELWSMIQSGDAAEPTIRRAIIVGNFEAAVECCLEAGLMAEALLLAQCGDQALRVRTQAAFFEKRRHQHPFLNVLHAVIRNELMTYVLGSDLLRWKETLALLSTYGKSDEFPALCEALANRLEVELKDTSSATLCYMCAANVIRTVGFWTAELNEANERLGRMDTVALENYVEKVVVFTHANPIDTLGPECAAFFSKYAELLASQGRLSVALSYMKGQNMAENILIDRLYHAGEKPAGSRPPNFPFPRTQLEPVAATQPSTPAVKPTDSTAAAAMKPTAMAGSSGSLAGRVNKGSSNPHLAAAAGSMGSLGGAVAMTPTPAAAPSPAAYVLPQDWLQLVDPASNRTYYVYTPTGQSQWEAPPSAAAPVAPTPAPVPAAVAPSAASPMTNRLSSNPSAEARAAGMTATAAATTGGFGAAAVNPSMNPAVSTFTPMAAATTPAGITTFNPAANVSTAAAAPISVAPAAAASASPTPAAAAPTVNLADTPEGQYVQYLGQIISTLSGR